MNPLSLYRVYPHYPVPSALFEFSIHTFVSWELSCSQHSYMSSTFSSLASSSCAEGHIFYLLLVTTRKKCFRFFPSFFLSLLPPPLLSLFLFPSFLREVLLYSWLTWNLLWRRSCSWLWTRSNPPASGWIELARILLPQPAKGCWD